MDNCVRNYLSFLLAFCESKYISCRRTVDGHLNLKTALDTCVQAMPPPISSEGMLSKFPNKDWHGSSTLCQYFLVFQHDI